MHVIVTFAPRFKSHPRSEMDTLDGPAGAAAKVNVEDTKESGIKRASCLFTASGDSKLETVLPRGSSGLFCGPFLQRRFSLPDQLGIWDGCLPLPPPMGRIRWNLECPWAKAQEVPQFTTITTQQLKIALNL